MSDTMQSVTKLRKDYDAGKATIEKMAEGLQAWRQELTQIEVQAAGLEKQRLDLVEQQRSDEARHLGEQLAKLTEHAADLRKLIPRQETRIREALAGLWDGELRRLAQGRHAADLEAARAARPEYEERLKALREAEGRLARAQLQADFSSNWPVASLNIKNRTAWIDSEMKHLTGQDGADGAFVPDWL